MDSKFRFAVEPLEARIAPTDMITTKKIVIHTGTL